jgi:hypothetical protein
MNKPKRFRKSRGEEKPPPLQKKKPKRVVTFLRAGASDTEIEEFLTILNDDKPHDCTKRK